MIYLPSSDREVLAPSLLIQQWMRMSLRRRKQLAGSADLRIRIGGMTMTVVSAARNRSAPFLAPLTCSIISNYLDFPIKSLF
jgi:hypothetical protein